jgi:predicted RNA-binding Zn ribbon-like protein
MLNRELEAAMAASTVAPSGEGFVWGWPESTSEPDLARTLWPLARSAAELLVSPERYRLRQCGGEGCGWVFLDETRGGRRRRCEMANCGNRSRIRAFARRRATAAQPAAVPGGRSAVDAAQVPDRALETASSDG